MMTLAGMELLLAAGCTASRPRWPAISETPTDVHIQDRWVWGELFADNVETEKTLSGDLRLAVRKSREINGERGMNEAPRAQNA